MTNQPSNLLVSLIKLKTFKYTEYLKPSIGSCIIDCLTKIHRQFFKTSYVPQLNVTFDLNFLLWSTEEPDFEDLRDHNSYSWRCRKLFKGKNREATKLENIREYSIERTIFMENLVTVSRTNAIVLAYTEFAYSAWCGNW